MMKRMFTQLRNQDYMLIQNGRVVSRKGAHMEAPYVMDILYCVHVAK